MLLFNELHRFNKTTDNTFASKSTKHSFRKFHCIVVLYFTHTDKLTMIIFLSLSTCKTSHVAIFKRKAIGLFEYHARIRYVGGAIG